MLCITVMHLIAFVNLILIAVLPDCFLHLLKLSFHFLQYFFDFILKNKKYQPFLRKNIFLYYFLKLIPIIPPIPPITVPKETIKIAFKFNENPTQNMLEIKYNVIK